MPTILTQLKTASPPASDPVRPLTCRPVSHAHASAHQNTAVHHPRALRLRPHPPTIPPPLSLTGHVSAIYAVKLASARTDSSPSRREPPRTSARNSVPRMAGSPPHPLRMWYHTPGRGARCGPTCESACGVAAATVPAGWETGKLVWAVTRVTSSSEFSSLIICMTE